MLLFLMQRRGRTNSKRLAVLALLSFVAVAGVLLATAISLLPGSPSPSRPGSSGSSRPSSPSCRGVEVVPGSNLQAAIDAHPTGTIFCLQPGFHRQETSLRPKSNQQFEGVGGAVVRGSKPVNKWLKQGIYWVASGQTQQSLPHGECRSGFTCRFNEDVFYDGRPLERAPRLEELRVGGFYLDYEQDRIYMVDDPRGHEIEASVAPHFLLGGRGVSGVVVRNLVIERFATPAQQGAIDANEGTGWIVAANEVQWVHGSGIVGGTRSKLLDNYLHHNGQHGVGATGRHVLVQGNEISQNGRWAGFSSGWSAGGAKFALTKSLVVRRNFVHHNHGPGLWTDVDNIDTLYEGNVVEDNSGAGIFHEISYRATLRKNRVRRNGHGSCEWLYGAGILIAHSRDVEVSENLVGGNCNGIAAVQQDRSSGAHGPYELRNLFVHDNVVEMASGHTGVADGSGNTAIFESGNNRFERNAYFLSSLSGRFFAWLNESVSKDAWRSYGNDETGRFSLSTESASVCCAGDGARPGRTT